MPAGVESSHPPSVLRPWRGGDAAEIGLAVSGATRCRYCAYFHAEAARLFGATEDEVTETALTAKNTMGWSTYLNTLRCGSAEGENNG